MATTTTCTTNNISITVSCFFLEADSNPIHSQFLFAYKIQIQNLGKIPVQLLRRKWSIIDAGDELRKVEGDGVIGKQPILEQNEEFEYVSGCQLHAELGKMWGTYTFVSLYDHKEFDVEIPMFHMIFPGKLN